MDQWMIQVWLQRVQEADGWGGASTMAGAGISHHSKMPMTIIDIDKSQCLIACGHHSWTCAHPVPDSSCGNAFFQQDKAGPHSAWLTRELFNNNNKMQVLGQPTSLTYPLNISGITWSVQFPSDVLTPKTRLDLFAAAVEEWHNIAFKLWWSPGVDAAGGNPIYWDVISSFCPCLNFMSIK